MRCIFCRVDASQCKGREHIIPESLGNVDHILPRGAVCDRCNNYFAREVEKPFLNSPGIELLRFQQALTSKKGRVPMVSGVILPDMPVGVTRYGPDLGLAVDFPVGAWERISRKERGTLIYPAELPR